MNVKDFFLRYARYNVWANEQIAEWIRAYPADLSDVPTASSFPTLRLTLLHVWDAQYIWLARLEGRPLLQLPSQGTHTSGAVALEGFTESARAVERFIAERPEAYFDDAIIYSNSSGQTFRHPVAGVLLHAIQHSAYHRGQIVSMGRGLGMTHPPQTDLIAFMRL